MTGDPGAHGIRELFFTEEQLKKDRFTIATVGIIISGWSDKRPIYFRTKGGITMADDNKCGHDGCVCTISGDDEFCSDHCRDADEQDIVEIKCDCGHSNCGG